MEKDILDIKKYKEMYKKDMGAANRILDKGFLKSPLDYAGLMVWEYREYILFKLEEERDAQVITSIIKLIEKEKDRDLTILLRYIRYLFPVKIGVNQKTKVARVKINKDGGNIEYQEGPTEMLEFPFFKELSKAIRVDNEKIENIKEALLNQCSGDWKKDLKTYLRWPTTDAPASLESLLYNGWITDGLLVYYGYHVGRDSNKNAYRHSRLDMILKIKIPDKIFHKEYQISWGEPSSMERLMKVARTIASLCRNAKRSPHNYDKAISEWECDLSYLKKKYYDGSLVLSGRIWPETSAWDY